VLIDWFTVAAQVANFLVLVLLLRLFLYGPIARVMDERQRNIDDQLSEAERLRNEATAAGQRHREAMDRFEAEQEDRARGLREELDEERRARLQEVRAEIDELQARWWAAVQRERDGFLHELSQRIAEQAIEVARRALQDLAGEELEAQIVHRFVESLQDVDPALRAALIRAAEQDGRRLHVRTAFPLTGELRDRLGAAVQEAVGKGHELRFDVVPTLLGGVEVRAGGQSLAWTLEDYLESLESGLSEVLAGEWGSRAGHG
jgi:F-type H+-transporting ATPase subunit b